MNSRANSLIDTSLLSKKTNDLEVINFTVRIIIYLSKRKQNEKMLIHHKILAIISWTNCLVTFENF